jgi:multicomponent Na+:H+ antiporter subunit G
MSAELLVTIVGSALLIFGASVVFSAAIGLLKLPDLYTRASAMGTAAGLGVSLMIVGVVVLDFTSLNLIKGFFAIIAQLLTSAIGSYVLARAGYLTGNQPVSTTAPDELAKRAADS